LLCALHVVAICVGLNTAALDPCSFANFINLLTQQYGVSLDFLQLMSYKLQEVK
jgi:hypothetical protein